jgi:hypothetical protein
MGANMQYLVPIFGMGFVGWFLYLAYREKQLKNEEKIALIEKGVDPSLLYPKPKDRPNSFKIGLLLIGTALGIVIGYILNLTWGIPVFVAYASSILVLCGILLVYFHKSKTE